MASKFKYLIDAYKKSDRGDIFGLYDLIGHIETDFKPKDNDELMSLTLALIREMLSEGFQAGNPAYSSTGYVPWDNQNPDYVVNRIKNEWLALGEEPSMQHIAWFAMTSWDLGA